MGAIVFNDVSFDSWLNKKSEEILLKGQGHGISNEEMLILILKANTTHFHHMDVEFRAKFEKIETRMDKFESSVNYRLEKMETKIDKLEDRMDDRFKEFEDKHEVRISKFEESVNAKFDKIWSFQKWQAGILIALFGIS